jgi:hypothetical protein
MKAEFKIFKQGRTDSIVTILSKIGEPFDRDFKIALYKYLGYSVYDLNGKEL